ncbi:DNA-directed RNA polymerase sigma-70 factor [Microbispora rosea subsp. aerata]|nr:RNA polymerase sigma factor [Microbispora rosea]GGO26101.1 DNA-directed RNA polymerase sigma-70 factor [Microbispora rosea subsp. aerata]GIH58211.1 DNA-directed RNA polymerase sigma-70 factor [Microbispora rosea subsp. aerata]GLJ87015.1 DNA-directed RNA polymerase sigma-70 factor [Microbispora rosea subsp. aerata]
MIAEEPGRADDAALIRRSEREPEVFADLFDRHAPALRRYVARRLGPSLADDVVSDTFLTAFRRRHRYDPSQPDARPWLYGIAARLIKRHRRVELRFYRALVRTGVDEITEPYADRVDARVSAQQAGLARALAELSPGDREVLLLVAWADMSYEDVARALDIPIGTVRSRLHRARAKTRQALMAAREEAFDG